MDLSKCYFYSAKEELETARILMKEGKFKASMDHSYSAVFHGLRSVIALAEFDSSKHSGAITFFNRIYVKEGIFDKSISKLVDTAYRLREKAGDQDLIILSKNRNMCIGNLHAVRIDEKYLLEVLRSKVYNNTDYIIHTG